MKKESQKEKGKNKKSSLALKIVSCLMICCMSFLFAGCEGLSFQDFLEIFGFGGGGGGGGSVELPEGGEAPEVDVEDALTGGAIEMQGVKVLYRPDSYDYDVGTGGTAENPTNYYGQYAWAVLNGLYQTYAIPNQTYALPYLGFDSTNAVDVAAYKGMEPYLYDSVRYQVDTVGVVTKSQVKAADGTFGEVTEITDPAAQYTIVGANTASKWNWSFAYDYIYDAIDIVSELGYSPTLVESDKVYKKYTDEPAFSLALTQSYGLIQEDYQQTYLGAPDQTQYGSNSDYVKALEYVIYSYALDLEVMPEQISISYGDPTKGEKPYTIEINDEPVDRELKRIKELFKTVGSFVGLTERQGTKIKSWIVKNVIGSQTGDSISYYNEVVEILEEQPDGSKKVIDYQFTGKDTAKSGNLGRNYEQTVSTIVDAVCQYVSIGTDDVNNGSGTIEDSFLASEICEYAGNMFIYSDDSRFMSDNEFEEWAKGMNLSDEQKAQMNAMRIPAKEYQSVAFMFHNDTETRPLEEYTTIDGGKKKGTLIDDFYIALKYDADEDGTEEGVWDKSKYLDIIVELNFYSHEDDTFYQLNSKQVRVYDGPFDPYHENVSTLVPDMYEDQGNVYFYDWHTLGIEALNKHLTADGDLIVGGFNTDIGAKYGEDDSVASPLMTDVGTIGHYEGLPLVSQNPIVLVGTSPARRYYHLIEPSEDEDLGGKTYVTGRLNPDKFSGSDGCDYLEVTYKVLKEHKSDTSKNYKFYTGVSIIG